jgi:hypothetical protein
MLAHLNVESLSLINANIKNERYNLACLQVMDSECSYTIHRSDLWPFQERNAIYSLCPNSTDVFGVMRVITLVLRAIFRVTQEMEEIKESEGYDSLRPVESR